MSILLYFLINDGQHRKAAIEAAIAEDESLKEETISIVLYKDQGLQRSQQMFTDLNKHAVTTSKSLNTLYESKDPVALITKNVVNSISFLRKYTDKEKDNLSKYSSKIASFRVKQSMPYEFKVNYARIRAWEFYNECGKRDLDCYLLQTLPPNLFRFYFFDGEKISDFVFNSSKNSDFKDAFLKLCSLDTMEIIRENFRRISRSKAKGTMTLSAEYDRCLEADNLIAQRVECAEDEYREISNEILIIDQRLASLEKAYAKGGGISKKEWRSMQDQIAKEDARREGHHKWLKEMANNVLPFIILRTQLEELKAQIALEHKAQVDANVKSTIDTPEIKSIISGVLSRANIELADDISEKVIYEIASYASHTSQITPILNLSDFDRFELTAKINSLLAYDTNRVKEATDDIKASLKCVKRIRKKMERSSIENYDGYLQMKSDLNEQKSKCTQQLLEVDKELQELRAQKAISASKLAKAKSDYEALLKKQSIKVFKTWAGTQEYVDADTARFEKIWNRKDRNLKIFTIPQAVKNKIFELRSPDRPYSLPAGSSKWVHQDIAVKTFLEKEHGILAMATGTGKTVTAMKIINKLFDSGEIRRVVITMYGNDLLDQWAIQRETSPCYR